MANNSYSVCENISVSPSSIGCHIDCSPVDIKTLLSLGEYLLCHCVCCQSEYQNECVYRNMKHSLCLLGTMVV